jgi:hypothetical protein
LLPDDDHFGDDDGDQFDDDDGGQGAPIDRQGAPIDGDDDGDQFDDDDGGQGAPIDGDDADAHWGIDNDQRAPIDGANGGAPVGNPGAPTDGGRGDDVPAAYDNGAPPDGGDQGAPCEGDANDGDYGGASTEGDQGAPEDGDTERGEVRPYNLRPRTDVRGTFNQAMDAPHDGRSYFPPMQLLQRGSRITSHATNRFRFIFGYIMNQMTATAGIKKHGKAAEAAIMREFAQLEELDVYESIAATSLSQKQRKAALRAINLIKEKRSGELKGRTVADGRPQRSLYGKSETASPTVSTDALVLSIMIDAHEGRDTGTADVVGAYLKANMDDFVVMKFTGASVDILCKLNPAHAKHVTIENGWKVLYVRLIKAIYGCVKSALLWYDLFHGFLKDLGFVVNPYEPCVANKVINGKQCTIAWYVDDAKISHADPKVGTLVIGLLEKRFRKMPVTRGTEHVFLGMNIRYTGEGTAVVTMKRYLEEALMESEMDITREAATPAQRCLFDVDEASPALGRHEAEVFHRVVAKLLYVSTRARADLLLAIAFLCTRVSKCTQQDRTKLKRVLEYIKGSINLEYTIGADDMGRMRTWVDAAFAVHPDMKSHTGGVISFGTGGVAYRSWEKKLNTKSSTEAEFVGASDYLPHPLWVKMFLEAQGYMMRENILEQDNESAIKLEKNGRTSAGPKSRHIDIRYYWIKDRVKTGDVTIRHSCPTLSMLADFFTKPLQGTLFRQFRDALLGRSHVDTLATCPMTPPKERVEDPRDARGVCHTAEATGVIGTVTDSTVRVPRTQVPRVTWADVVRKAPAATQSERASSDRRYEVLLKRSGGVSRSLS